MAISMKGEARAHHIPLSRPLEDTNLIILIGQYVSNSDTLLLKCNQYFVEVVARFFLLLAFASILFVNFFFTILVVSLIRIELVVPITELV